MRGSGCYSAVALAAFGAAACGASLSRFADSVPAVARTIGNPGSSGYADRLQATCVDRPTCAIVEERSRLLGLGLTVPGNLVRPLISSSLQWLEDARDFEEDCNTRQSSREAVLAQLDSQPRPLSLEIFTAIKDTRDAVERSVSTRGALEPFRLAVSAISGIRSPACRLDGPDAARLAVLQHELEVTPQTGEQPVVVVGARAPTRCFAIATLGRPPPIVVLRSANAESGPGLYISGPQRRGRDLVFDVGSYVGDALGGGGGECTVRQIGSEWRVIECLHTWDG